jgi:hypothetical protein
MASAILPKRRTIYETRGKMNMHPVIEPEVINILSGDSTYRTQQYVEQSHEEPEKKPSFWQKASGFFKKAMAAIKPILEVVCVLATALNAYSRFRNAMRPLPRTQRAW